MRKLLPIFLVILLTGCAHVVASDLRAQAEKDLNVEDLFANPTQYSGKTVMLGGEVINTVNLEDGTEIEVLEKPLDSRGRPLNTDLSRGRFIVIHPDRLDPAIFAPGREITTVATVTGFELRELGETDYAYLKLEAKAVYIHRYNAAGRRVPVHFGLGVFHSF
jgi:outer membrane lipoprotein